MRNISERIQTLAKEFDPISLGELNTATLMERVDKKYWFSIELLPNLLSEILDDYLLLNINEQAFQFYRTYYFDTPTDGFYLDHHNGRRNRIKIRIREYVQSQLRFLEVKQKSNTGKTCKYRRQIEKPVPTLNEHDAAFIGPFIGCPPSSLDIKIQNQFQRITLVNRNLKERCTIDLNLQFQRDQKQAQLEHLVVLELKQESAATESSRMTRILSENKIRPRGFSKYCMGRALLQPELKQNRLKPALIQIQKEAPLQRQLESIAACF